MTHINELNATERLKYEISEAYAQGWNEGQQDLKGRYVKKIEALSRTDGQFFSHDQVYDEALEDVLKIINNNHD